MDLRTAEVGIRHALIIEGKESRRKSPRGLGFASVNYGNLFVRDKWTLFAIARELDCSVEDILSPPEKREGPRWSELIQASEDILGEVRTLPGPTKTLVLKRGEGLSWRKIQQEFPGRMMFSLREDHERGIQLVIRRARDHLNFLASFDNFFVVRGREAA